MKKLKKIKLPKWVLSVLGFIQILFEYFLYVHDRLLMSWTARTLVRIQVWYEVTEYKKRAFARVVLIWGSIGLYKLIF